jgi:hypothetical protein
MTIRAASNTYQIPINPPMKALSEARSRLVEMDADCIKELGRSPITVNAYKYPKGFHTLVFWLTCSTYIMLLREQHVHPGSVFYDYHLRWIPYFPYIAQTYRLHILALMVIIHGGETYIMSGQLKKHSVVLFSVVWWQYMISCFIEGFGSFQR